MRHTVSTLITADRLSQRVQELGAQIVVVLVLVHTEPGERVCDRIEGTATGGVVLGDDGWERSRPTAAVRRQRRPVDLQKAPVDPALPPGPGPVREALIEIGGRVIRFQQLRFDDHRRRYADTLVFDDRLFLR